jgi:hypothetical protein
MQPLFDPASFLPVADAPAGLPVGTYFSGEQTFADIETARASLPAGASFYFVHAPGRCVPCRIKRTRSVA